LSERTSGFKYFTVFREVEDPGAGALFYELNETLSDYCYKLAEKVKISEEKVYNTAEITRT